MNYFQKPNHAYHRVIFEFTDKEVKDTGFERLSFMPSNFEILRILQRIMDKELNKTKKLFDLSVKKDLWKAKALRLIGFLDDKDKEIERLTDINKAKGALIKAQAKKIGNLLKEKEWLIELLYDKICETSISLIIYKNTIEKIMQQALKDQP